jgi:hypothetical protein
MIRISARTRMKTFSEQPKRSWETIIKIDTKRVDQQNKRRTWKRLHNLLRTNSLQYMLAAVLERVLTYKSALVSKWGVNDVWFQLSRHNSITIKGFDYWQSESIEWKLITSHEIMWLSMCTFPYCFLSLMRHWEDYVPITSVRTWKVFDTSLSTLNSRYRFDLALSFWTKASEMTKWSIKWQNFLLVAINRSCSLLNLPEHWKRPWLWPYISITSKLFSEMAGN